MDKIRSVTASFNHNLNCVYRSKNNMPKLQRTMKPNNSILIHDNGKPLFIKQTLWS